MITSIISIGNSKGVRIPKFMLEESGLGSDIELRVKKGEITIVPARKRTSPTIRLSEKVLAQDWDRPEEDLAWKDLK